MIDSIGVLDLMIEYRVCIVSIIRVPKLVEISQTDPGCKMLVMSFLYYLVNTF